MVKFLLPGTMEQDINIANRKVYYNSPLAQKKSSKNTAHYYGGGIVLLFKTVSYFKAKNITFENSFNRYIT